MHEQIDPDISGYSQYDGKKHHKGTNNGQKGCELIHTNEHIADHEGRHGKGDANAITHVHGSIKEGGLYFVFGIAMAATLLHEKGF
jgi:hypothetical protein